MHCSGAEQRCPQLVREVLQQKIKFQQLTSDEEPPPDDVYQPAMDFISDEQLVIS